MWRIVVERSQPRRLQELAKAPETVSDDPKAVRLVMETQRRIARRIFVDSRFPSYIAGASVMLLLAVIGVSYWTAVASLHPGLRDIGAAWRASKSSTDLGIQLVQPAIVLVFGGLVFSVVFLVVELVMMFRRSRLWDRLRGCDRESARRAAISRRRRRQR